MEIDVQLRDVTEDDLPIFFEQQCDRGANHMAAFTAKDPLDFDAFAANWTQILGDETIKKRTIVAGGHVAGNVLSFVAPWSGQREISYWIGKEFWGKGIATKALAQFLCEVTTRPLYARAAMDNIASIRVLEKCGFAVVGHGKGFANARGKEIAELVFSLENKADHDAPRCDTPNQVQPDLSPVTG